MKNNFYFLLILIVFFVFCSCSERIENGAGTGGKPNKIKIETIDGIPHVYNTEKPLKGEVTLELEKLCEIDSEEIDRAQPPSFSQFNHSGDRIYLFDVLQFKLYFYDTGGKLLKQLLIKGQGPGEIERITQFILAPYNNELWIPSDGKIMRYNPDGKFLDEFKLNKQYREISILDENRFIGKYFVLNPKEPDETKQRKLSCMMFDKEDKVLASYLEEGGLGGLAVMARNPNGQFMRVVFVMPPIVPDILYGIDRERQLIYLCKNMEYVIYLKNLKGEMLRVIHREHKNKLLTEEDRKDVVDQQLLGQPAEFKKLLAANLPKSFCAVLSIHPLSNGFLAIYQITGPQKYVVDIFDPEGQYIYQLKFPGGIDFPQMQFYPGGIVGVVQTVNDRDIYREYRIKNLTEIFGNATK